MKNKTKFILSVIIFSLISTGVFAETLTAETGNISLIETTETDISVRVEKMVNGTKTTVYTGLLGGYDNGAWADADFTNIDMAVIFDWATNDITYIYPIDESVSVNNVNTAYTYNLLQASNELSLSSQIKINGVNVGENGLRIIDNANLNCNLSIGNNTSDTHSVSVILATYTEDKKLYNMKFSEIEIEDGETGNIQLIYTFNAEHEDSAKLMLWDSISGMVPLKTAIEFNGDSGVTAYYYNADNRLLQIDKLSGNSLVYTYDNTGNLLTKTVRE